MSADLAARLRALAQDYHEGRINLAAYRTLRAPLLDSLVATVPSVADSEITRPRAVRPGPVTTESPSSQSEPGRRLPFGVIGVAVGLVALTAVVFWVFSGEGPPGGDSGEVSSGASLVGPVHEVVVPFMERGDWGDAQLTRVNASLLELGDRELAGAAPEPWFQRFVDELRRRLKEHQALAASPLTPDSSAIAALAVTVGLDLNSPDAAIRIATVEEPRPAPGDKHATTGAAASQTEQSADRGGAHDADSNSIQAGSRVPPNNGAESASASTGTGANVGSGVAPDRNAASGGVAPDRNAASGSVAPDRNADPGGGAPGARAGTSVRSSGATFTSASTEISTRAVAAPASSDAGRDSACRVELVRSRRPLCNDLLPTGEGPLLALVPAGSFDMGSATVDVEQPVHKVTISAPFAISVNEVSQAEFRQFCEHTRRSCAEQPWAGDDYPVVNVSWDDARAYAEWLSSVTHQRYRLPSEAQWEYAARAGQTGPVPGGDALSPTDAHFSMTTRQTAPARRSEKFKANGFRLLHTLGNVREWVEDAWVQTYAGAPTDGSSVKSAAAGLRVARGGSYADGATRLRLSVREGLPEGTRDSFTGFRVVRELP